MALFGIGLGQNSVPARIIRIELDYLLGLFDSRSRVTFRQIDLSDIGIDDYRKRIQLLRV